MQFHTEQRAIWRSFEREKAGTGYGYITESRWRRFDRNVPRMRAVQGGGYILLEAASGGLVSVRKQRSVQAAGEDGFKRFGRPREAFNSTAFAGDPSDNSAAEKPVRYQNVAIIDS